MHFSTLLRAFALATVIPRIAALPQGWENELDTADTTEWDEEEPTNLAAEPTTTPIEWEEQEQDLESVSEDDTALEYGVVPEEVDFEDASFNETSVPETEDPFIALGEWPEPWVPDCYSDADRALWKWRQACDRIKTQKLHHVCWTRAPKRDMCCKPKINHEDLVLYPDGGKSSFNKEGSCGQWWPYPAYERFICAENCKIDDLRGMVTSRSCKFMNGKQDFKINNPEGVCKCMVKHCRW